MRWTPRLLKFAMNIYGPFIGAGIRIAHIDREWRSIRVTMKLRWYNRNIMGTHFGGSLYAMIDPQMMIMLMNRLGRDYIVWDQAAEIHYIKPARGTVQAQLSLTDEQLDEIRRQCANGQAYRPDFMITIRDQDGVAVTRVKKVLYVRKKPASEQSASKQSASKQSASKQSGVNALGQYHRQGTEHDQAQAE